METIHPEVTVAHYGALRGLDAFGTHDAGLIIGRPMPNQARLALLAVSAFGIDVLGESRQMPDLPWTLHQQQLQNDSWLTRIQRYDDPRWQAVWQHVVTGELMQAIGRLRPLSNPADIYVLTCEPLSSAFEIQGIYAGELFPEMYLFGRRKDFIERAKEYAQAMKTLIDQNLPATNASVCRMLGIPESNGLRYRELAKSILAQRSQNSPFENTGTA